MKTIATPHLSLEPQVVAHAHEMFGVLSDPAIYEFENAPPESEEWLTTRYERLESRGPDSSRESWLNWVVRLPTGELAGYVQATIQPEGSSFVAYEFNSRFWRRGIGSKAVLVMLEELTANYSIHTYIAVLKENNFRSEALLRKLGFFIASAEQQVQYRDEQDEIVMVKSAGKKNAASEETPR